MSEQNEQNGNEQQHVHDHGDGTGPHAHEPRYQQVQMEVRSVASPDVDMQAGSHFQLAGIPTLVEFEAAMFNQGERWIVLSVHDVGGVIRRVFPPHIAEVHLRQLAELLGKEVVDAVPGIQVAKNLNGVDPRMIG